MKIKYALILTILFGIRFIGLSQSFWLDEAITAQRTLNMGYNELVTGFSVNDFHPPLHYMVVKVFENFINNKVLAVRLPSILASLVGALVMYQMGGFWGSALFLSNPLLVYYSQEGRMYMFCVMWLLLTWYGISLNRWWANITAFLALFTFYGSGFYLVGLLLVYRKNWKNVLPGMMIALLILAPLLREQFKFSKIALQTSVNWGSTLGQLGLKNLLLFPLKFFGGRVSFYPKIIYFGLAGLWSATLLWLVSKKIDKKTLIITLTPIVLGGLVSLWSPMFLYFRFIYLIPGLLLVLNQFDKKIKAGVVMVTLIWTGVYLFNPNQYREDWKGLAESMKNGDVLILSENFAEPINFYNKNVETRDFKTLPLVKNDKLWVTGYGTDIMKIDYKKVMTLGGYEKTKEVGFRGIVLEEWTRLDRELGK